MSDEFSQDEVDALVNNTTGEEGEAAPAAPQPSAAQDDANIELTQEELDSLLNNVGEKAPTAAPATPGPPSAGPQPVAHPVRFPALSNEGSSSAPSNMDFLMDVSLQVSVELGRSKMLVKDILNVGMGSVIELDKLSGEPVDVMLNGKLIAYGEVVVVDENFGVKIVDVISPDQRMDKLS